MKFSFGIITAAGDLFLPNGKLRNDSTDVHLVRCLNSILDLKIPNEDFEVIVVGGNDPKAFWERYAEIGDRLTWVSFDESERAGWITKKKNIITQHAGFENVVYLLDYYEFSSNWYQGYLKLGNDWDVSMCVKVSYEGLRFRDWIAWDDPDICFQSPPTRGYQYKPWEGYSEPGHISVSVPYTYDQTEYMYISGGFWVAKKQHMIDYPLCEDILWGGSEDVEWSKRWMRDGRSVYKMNTFSTVHLLKSKRLSCAYSHDGKNLYPGRSVLSSKSGIPPEWCQKDWHNHL